MKNKLKTVLLIDDDENTNFYNEIIINQLGITEQIKTFQFANEALVYLTTKTEGSYPQPEIIFLDINMPIMNGWQFMEKYKQLDDEQKGKIIVVMLTSSFNYDDKIKSEQINEIDTFLNKPLNQEMLSDLMKKYFNY